MAYRQASSNNGNTVRGHLKDYLEKVSGWAWDIITRGPGNGGQQASINLLVLTQDGEYTCQSGKQYTEMSSIKQDLTSTDGFITLSTFSKSVSALTVHNAKIVVLKNLGTVPIEIAMTTTDWINDGGSDGSSDTTTDIVNSIDIQPEGTTAATTLRTWTFILPADDFVYLPTSRVISYTPYTPTSLESGGNSAAGGVDILPSAINSGNEFKKAAAFSGTTYASGSDILIDGTVSDITSTTVVVDDGDWFEKGDLLILGNSQNEVVEVESVSGTTLNIKRGLLGTTAAAITNNHEIAYFFGNEYLKYNDGKCKTDKKGRFRQRGAFFGYGRSADKKTQGVVPGSVAIGPFYIRGGYLDWGLDNIRPSDETGLTAGATYTFTIVVDEFHINGFGSVSSEQAIAFTLDGSDTTFHGSSRAVIPKIQAVLDQKYYDASSGLFNKKVSIFINNGDIRVKSHTNHSDTRVGIGNTTGTTPFGVGRFPSKDGNNIPILKGTPTGSSLTDPAVAIVFGPAASLPQEIIDDPVTAKALKNKGQIIHDDGKGNLVLENQVVGKVDYSKGHTEFIVPWADAEFKIAANTLSAHAGGTSYTLNGKNTLESIHGRSLNQKLDAKVELLLLG